MPKINLTWNQIITMAMMALQYFAVGNLVTSPTAIRWMLGGAGFIKLMQIYVAANSNPDGTPIDKAAMVTKTTTEVAIEPRKDVPAIDKYNATASKGEE